MNGKRKGPFGDQQIQQLLVSRALGADSLVWKQGMSAWQPIGQVPDLAHVLASLPPEAPPTAEPVASEPRHRFTLQNLAIAAGAIVAIVPFALIAISSISEDSDEKWLDHFSFKTTPACEEGTPVSGQFYVKGNEIKFRTGPGTNYSSVINQRATHALGKTDYRTLSSSIVLEGLCETDEWLKAHITKADGRPVDWETGWVHKQFLTQNASAQVQAGLIWDIDNESDFTNEEKALVKRGALKVLKDEKNCESIPTGYRSGSRKGAYYVTCNAKKRRPAV